MTDPIDFRTRKPVQVDTPQGENVQQFMNRWKKTIKDGKFTNIAIIVMDENKYCDFGTLTAGEFELSILAHMMDEVKKSMMLELFEEDGSEDDEEGGES